MNKNKVISMTMGAVLSAGTALAVSAPSQKAPLQEIGQGEGEVNLVVWEGYAQPEWVKPFEEKTSCQVNVKYAGSSDEMVALMRTGGGSVYDLVSASGDASLRLIYGGNVQPLNMNLIPAWDDFIPQLKSPPFNTVNDVHYGLSYEWGPNVLLYNTEAFDTVPTSWDVIYSDKYAGRITVPDNPIHIADAALYLMSHSPELGIKDPYELTQDQLSAVVKLLKKQRGLIKKYWGLASTEISLFKNDGVVVGSSWPYQTNALQEDGVPVESTIPKEGVTGWADSWMLSSEAPHPNCAYQYMNYASTPKVQAMQALYFGETPANTKACDAMDELQEGSCTKWHLNAPASYFESIYFWKTPRKQCESGEGQECTTYTEWLHAWQRIKG